MNIHLNKIINAQIIIFVLILVILSWGQMARWDLLQPIAMTDRYSLLGSLYPDLELAIPTGVSSYFPGVTVIALMVKNIVPNNLLIYSMHLIAVLVLLSFFMVQKRIAYSISKNVNIDNYYIAVIIFTLIFCRQYLVYAVEFKPDTIAFLFGALGIIIAKADKNTSIKVIPYVLGACLTGCALIFKQQYIAFLVGMIIYSLVSKNSKFQIFTALSIMFSFLILYMFYKQENFLFWTVTYFSDDGFFSIKGWVLNQAKLIVLITKSIIVLWGAHLYGYVKIDLFASFISLKHLLMTPWPVLIFMSALAAFATSWKLGSNTGNTELGLILLFPLIYFAIQKLDKKLLMLLAWLGFLGLATPIHVSVLNIQNSTALNQAVSSLALDSNTKVLTGSDVYGAARLVKTLNPIHDLWTIRVITKDKGILSSILTKQNYDVLILDPENRHLISASGLYSIQFENDLGIIAVRN
jgi:hypothetical protein